MKRVCLVLILTLAGVLTSLAAEGPDDLYVQVYQLMQDGDRMRTTGQIAGARAAYLDAYNRLSRLQTTYPRWNDTVVQFRLGDLVEKLRALPPDPTGQTSVPGGASPAPRATGAAPVSPPPGSASGAAPTTPARAGNDTDPQMRALLVEVQQLKDENAILQVKLTEALAARPSAADPQELRRAEMRILELEKEKEILNAALEREKTRATTTGAAAQTASLEEALKSSRAELNKQVDLANRLVRENEVLQVRLRDAERQLALARGGQPPASPTPASPVITSRPPAATSTTPAPATPATTAPDHSDEILRLQVEIGLLRLDKEALEAAQKELQAKLASRGPNAPAAMPGPARDEVVRQANTTSRDLLDNQARTETLEKELAAMKARVQVLESDRVPYTPEELALFRAPAPDFGRTNRLRRATPREYPIRDQRLYEQVRVDFEASRYSEAERGLSEMLRSDTQNVLIMADLATTQMQQRRFTDADTTLTRALRVDPASSDILRLYGRLNYDQRKFDAALDYFNRSAQLNPGNPETLNYLGLTLAEKGQRQAAETSIRRAIEVFAGYYDAHYNLAVIYANQDPPFSELARWHYQKAVALGHRENPDLQKKIEQGAAAAPSGPARP